MDRIDIDSVDALAVSIEKFRSSSRDGAATFEVSFFERSSE